MKNRFDSQAFAGIRRHSQAFAGIRQNALIFFLFFLAGSHVSTARASGEADFTWVTIEHCGSVEVTFTPIHLSGSHQWSTAAGLFSTATIPTQVFFPTQSPFTFDVIHQAGPFTETKAVTVTMSGGPYDLVIGTAGATTGTNSIPLLANGGTITGKNFYVKGQLLIEKNLIFNNCNFTMDEGAEIKLGLSRGIQTKNTVIEGCDHMWRGIRLDIGSSVRLFGSTLQDAEYGIRIASHCELVALDSKFLHNYVSIVALPGDPVDPNGYHNMSGTFVRNLCDNAGSFLPEYAGQQTATDLLAVDQNVGPTFINSGIVLWKTGYFSLGISSTNQNVLWQNRNVFQNLNYGVVGIRSNLSVKSSRFKSISTRGVFVKGDGMNQLTVAGFGKNYSEATFEDVRFGIGASFVTGKISEVSMKNVLYGILFINDGVRNFFIDNNSIELNNAAFSTEFPLWGVSVINTADPVFYKVIRLKNNEIIYNGPTNLSQTIPPFVGTTSAGQVGIEASGFVFAPLGNTQTEILGNTIRLNKGRFGIFSNQANGMRVADNQVFLNAPTDNFNGILLLKSNFDTLKNNTVTGISSTGTTVWQNTGIHVVNSNNFNFDCNNLFGSMNMGVVFEQPCVSQDKFKTTSFVGAEMKKGLFLADGSMTGSQTHMGNVFDIASNGASMSDGDAVYLGNMPIASRFKYNKNENLFFEPTPVFPAGNSWFEPTTIGGPAPVGCSPGFTGGGGGENLTETDIFIAGNLVSAQHHEANIKWLADEYLLNKLMANPSLENTNSTVLSFWQGKNGGSLMRLLQVGIDISTIKTAATASQWTSIEQAKQAMTDKLAEIAAIDDLIAGFPLDEAEASLYTQREQKMGELVNLSASVGSQWASIRSLMSSRAAQIRTQNASISPTLIQETNLKTVNDCYLSVLYQEEPTFNSTQQAQLLAIANQCYYDGGPAVLTARSLLSWVVGESVSFSENCGTGGFLLKNAGKSPVLLLDEFEVWPNPAAESAMIRRRESDSSGQLLLFDLNGRAVFQATLEAGETEIAVSTQSFLPGMFTVKLISGDQISFRKLLVIH